VRALPLVVIALAGCPGEDPVNAPTLWLAPDGSEIVVKLAEEEPEPW
jgi:hypothetical protein